MTGDDKRNELEVAADVALMILAAGGAGLDASAVATAVGAYQPRFEAVAAGVGVRVAEQANAGADVLGLLTSTTVGITAGVGVYTAAAVLLSAQLLEVVVHATGRDAGEVIAEILERNSRG